MKPYSYLKQMAPGVPLGSVLMRQLAGSFGSPFASPATASVRSWVKRAQTWIDNTRQEVDVKGEKKLRSVPDPAQTKALNALLIWLENEDLDLLRDPGFTWLDLRRLGAAPGAGLLAHADDIATSKAPEGPAGELTLLPTYEPVMAESKFSKGDEKRQVLSDVKQGAPAANLAEQMAAFEKLARSRELDAK